MRYRAFKISSNEYNYDLKKWTGWSEWSTNSFLIVVNVTAKNVKLYTNGEPLTFDITRLSDAIDATDGSVQQSLYCVSSSGTEVEIKRQLFDGGRAIFYVYWSDLYVAYATNRLD